MLAGDGDEVVQGERVEVSLARLEGKLEQVATLLEQRAQRLERDAHEASSKATRAHERIDVEVDGLRRDLTGELDKVRLELRADVRIVKDGVEELTRWRERMVGMAVGVSVGSGVLSGGLVAAITTLAGG